MSEATEPRAVPSREQLAHMLYEAAELEHNLMCTYLYAAFSLKRGESEGLTATEAEAVERWRRVILDVAIEEMGHLVAVWNITAALGVAPRFGRTNFPLDPGLLPAGVVVKLAPFSAATLQHFIYLERPAGSDEPDGAGFASERNFVRAAAGARLVPMGLDYATVGAFYETLGSQLRGFVAQIGERAAFCGERSLQLSRDEIDLGGAQPVICLKTALAAFDSIVLQGEGAPRDSADSHFAKFLAVRAELQALQAANASFVPAYPAATNPVLRRPPRPEGRVWIEDEQAARTVDLSNAGYALMLRLLAYAYTLPRPIPQKALTVDLAIGLMQAVTMLAERAARLPAGPSNPGCTAGVSFTALRDAAALPAGASAAQFFVERFAQLASAGQELAAAAGDERSNSAARQLAALSQRSAGLVATPSADRAAPIPAVQPTATPPSQPVSSIKDGVEHAEGEKLTLLFEGKRCIHSRFCVTCAPTVFLANVKGAWLHPDTIDAERLVEIAHACPSGAIRYVRKDGRPQEAAPPVNLVTVREAGPYAFRGDLYLDGAPIGYRATLCRCGASKNKPYCDSSHVKASFTASGEPPTRSTEMLASRGGPLAIDPQLDGPLRLRGSIEIISGTGRVVARTTSVKLCRCGGSQTKPFCDGTHARIGFKSEAKEPEHDAA